jgi:hypothetical protein
VPRRAVLLVIAVALAAVLAGLGNDFTQDDLRLIYENSRVHGLGRWREILGSPYWPPPWNQELYRPVVSLLHALQYTLGGGEPLLFRLVSYLLYALTAVALLRLAGRLTPHAAALLAALLFAAHPVHVEAVALAVGQSELLVGLLALVMTILYLDRRRRGDLRPADWLVLGGLYVLASMTKEQGLLIPALLVAAELTLIEGGLRQRIRSTAGGFAGLAALAVAVVLVRRVVLEGEFTGVFVSEALQGQDFAHRALTLLQIIPHWARLLLWPAALQADYAPGELWISSRFGALEALGLAILLLALGGAWLLRRRAPAVTFGILWMGVTLFPVSNLLVPTGFLLAERTLFLPSVGLAIAVAGLLALVFTPARGLSRELIVACGVLVLLGIGRSVERQRVWRNEAFLTVRTVQDAPRSYRAQRAYGDVLFNLGHDSLGLAAYAEALRLAPAGHGWRVRNDLARRFRVRGETEREVEQLRRSLQEMPSQGDVRGYLISGYLLLGRYAEAAREVDSAVAHGGRPELFRRLREIADSASRVGAPPGTIRIRIVTEPAG